MYKIFTWIILLGATLASYQSLLEMLVTYKILDEGLKACYKKNLGLIL